MESMFSALRYARNRLNRALYSESENVRLTGFPFSMRMRFSNFSTPFPKPWPRWISNVSLSRNGASGQSESGVPGQLKMSCFTLEVGVAVSAKLVHSARILGLQEGFPT